MNVTPIGGKSPSETVVGVAVNAGGAVVTEKAWRNTVTKIAEDESPTSGTHACTAVDLADLGAVSLRVSNNSDQDISLGVYADHVTNSYALRDATMSVSKFAVPAGRTNVVITPDDWPILQWLAKLRLYYTVSSNASGNVNIWAVTKG